jgi:hypothetical protein
MMVALVELEAFVTLLALPAALLVTALDVVEPLPVTVVVVAGPLFVRKYPPKAETAKAATTTTAATVLETPTLERRTMQNSLTGTHASN